MALLECRGVAATGGAIARIDSQRSFFAVQGLDGNVEVGKSRGVSVPGLGRFRIERDGLAMTFHGFVKSTGRTEQGRELIPDFRVARFQTHRGAQMWLGAGEVT